MKLLFVLLVIGMLLSVACTRPQYQVKSWQYGDEAVYYLVCSPSVRHCTSLLDANPINAENKEFAPVGAWCRPVPNNETVLDCGKRYYQLQLLRP
jgi:hypothetical protein